MSVVASGRSRTGQLNMEEGIRCTLTRSGRQLPCSLHVSSRLLWQLPWSRWLTHLIRVGVGVRVWGWGWGSGLGFGFGLGLGLGLGLGFGLR